MELYYYTSTDTMMYILSKGDIYATNIRYMNDSEEYINGLKELHRLSKDEILLKEWLEQRKLDKSLLDKIKNIFSEDNYKENMENMEYYSISFCEKNDLLSQWAIYAKESGVSIKLDFEKAMYNFTTKSFERNGKAEWQLLPQKVFYFTYNSMKKQRELYNNIAYEILNQLYPQDSKDLVELKNEKWRYMSTFIKRYDFYQEVEYRLVFEPNQSAYPPIVQYRHDNKVLKPYLDIVCEDEWPIWEIMIGPGFNQQVVYNSVEHFLEHSEVKTGIRTTTDYIERIKKYLNPYGKYLKECKEYNELNNVLFKDVTITKMDLEEAKIIFSQKLRAIFQSVYEEDKYNDSLKQYFMNCHFTKCGVVLSKSSIPYIF